MKAKLFSSLLSVPAAYIIWQVCLEFLGAEPLSTTLGANLVGGLVGIIALSCMSVNVFILSYAIKHKSEPLAKLTIISTTISAAVALTALAFLFAALFYLNSVR